MAVLSVRMRDLQNECKVCRGGRESRIATTNNFARFIFCAPEQWNIPLAVVAATRCRCRAACSAAAPLRTSPRAYNSHGGSGGPHTKLFKGVLILRDFKPLLKFLQFVTPLSSMNYGFEPEVAVYKIRYFITRV